MRPRAKTPVFLTKHSTIMTKKIGLTTGNVKLVCCVTHGQGGQGHDKEFDDTENLGGLEAESTRREIISTDGKVGVFLLQYTGILLKYLKFVLQVILVP